MHTVHRKSAHVVQFVQLFGDSFWRAAKRSRNVFEAEGMRKRSGREVGDAVEQGELFFHFRDVDTSLCKNLLVQLGEFR